jgi:hypothetical protein
MAVKVEDESFKERRQSIPDEIAEAPGTAVFGGKPMLVDKFADVEQESVDAVVAVELDAPKVLGVKLYNLNGGEPTKQVMQIGAGAFV